MDFPLVMEYVAPLLGFFGFGTFALIGLRMWFRYRTARLGSGGREEMERLTETVEGLRAQLDAFREETAELHERLDFAERLLARAKPDDVPKLDRPLR